MPAKSNGQVIVLKVAMDESGIHHGSPVVTVGAYVARPRQWQEWTKRCGNPLETIIDLQFEEKKDYVPLQAADILAYEGNKRLRDPNRPERRAWTALDPDKTRLFAAYYGRENMIDLISRLEMIRDGRFSEIDQGVGWKRAAQSVGAGHSLDGLLA